MEAYSILLLEDNLGDLDLIKYYFNEISDWDVSIAHATHIREAESLLSNHVYDVVLSDMNLPDSKGIETVTRMAKFARGIPLVVLTGHSDNATGLEAIRQGAQDYLVKDEITPRLLVKTIQYAIERNNSKMLIESMAIKDDLTGLYNRTGLKLLSTKIAELGKRHGKKLGIIFLDIDDFKEINDNYGHNEGDIALVDTAQLLLSTFRHSDVVSRIGGDEFVVFFLCENDCKESDIKTRVSANLKVYNDSHNKKWQLQLSSGVVIFSPKDSDDFENEIHKADRLMYEDKYNKKASL